jgi:hypothetical protein
MSDLDVSSKVEVKLEINLKKKILNLNFKSDL